MRILGRAGETNGEAGNSYALQRDASDVDPPDVVYFEPNIDNGVGAYSAASRLSASIAA